MAVSVIDGTVEEAVPGRRAAKVQFFKHIKFRLNDGTTRSIAKPVVHCELAPHLQPGTIGRFYLFTAIDHRGIHGLCDSQGRAFFQYPRNNEVIMLGLVVLMVLWAAFSIALVGDLGIIPAIILLLGPGAWFLFRKSRIEAERQFAADGGFVPAPRAVVAPEPAVGG